MKTFSEQPSRTNAGSVATACVLVVILVMGASRLFTAEPSALQVTAGVATTHVAQAYAPGAHEEDLDPPSSGGGFWTSFHALMA